MGEKIERGGGRGREKEREEMERGGGRGAGGEGRKRRERGVSRKVNETENDLGKESEMEGE